MPLTLSISAQVGALAPNQRKEYLWTMPSHGLEIGFGRRGDYQAHAHRNLIDVVFAPDGMCVGTPGSPEMMRGTLLIALPGTWFGPVRTTDMFFVKFYRDERHTGVPDKLVERAQAGQVQELVVTDGPTTVRVPMFRPGFTASGATAELRLCGRELVCDFAGAGVLLVTP